VRPAARDGRRKNLGTGEQDEIEEVRGGREEGNGGS